MNASIAGSAASLAGWLADFYLLVTLLLVITLVGLRRVRQPVHRLTVARTVMVELALLAAVCALPGWPRISLFTAAPNAADEQSPAAVEDGLRELPRSLPAGAAGVPRAGSVRGESAAGALEAGDRREARPPASPEPPISFEPSRGLALPPLPVWVAGAFLVGLGLVAMWLAWGAAGAAMLCKHSSAAPAAVQRELSAIVRGGWPPRLLLSPRIGNAVALGVLRPTILLPASLAQRNPPQALRAVLAHEWAHIRNRDLWLLALGRCLLALLFAHPLYWWLRRRIRDDQEAVADAVAARDNRQDYAEKLLDWAKMTAGVPRPRLSTAAGIWEGPSQLSKRIAMLLDETFRVTPAASRRWRHRAFALLTVLGLGLSVVTLRAAPPKEKEQSPPQVVGKSKLGETLTYTGKVTDWFTGKPIAGATVTVRRAIDSSTFETRVLQETRHTTDPQGRYTFSIAPEQQAANRDLYFTLDVSHPRYCTKTVFPYYVGTLRDAVRLGLGPYWENLRLIPGEEISGTILTPEGAPASGIAVRSYSMLRSEDGFPEYQSRSYSATTTNDKGFFRLPVAKGGDAMFWPLPEKYAPCERYVGKKRGDQGRIVLEEGVTLKGRAVDVKSSPVSGVWVNASLSWRPALDHVDLPTFSEPEVRRRALTNAQGEFSMNPLPVGEYTVEVLHYTGDPRIQDPAFRVPPAVFVSQTLQLKQGENTPSIEFRAVPHVVIEGRYVTYPGHPPTGDELPVSGEFGDQHYYAQASVDASGKFLLNVPKGLKRVDLGWISDYDTSLRWRKSKAEPWSNGDDIELGTLDHDVRGIEIVRFEYPIVYVKAVAEDGSPPKGFAVKADYAPGRSPLEGKYSAGPFSSDVAFVKLDDGPWWRSHQLLPNEEFTLTVQADGFKPHSEKFKLPEGAIKELVVKLQKQ